MFTRMKHMFIILLIPVLSIGLTQMMKHLNLCQLITLFIIQLILGMKAETLGVYM
jgi:hypothetical protein